MWHPVLKDQVSPATLVPAGCPNSKLQVSELGHLKVDAAPFHPKLNDRSLLIFGLVPFANEGLRQLADDP
jgi:hypothetical protein